MKKKIFSGIISVFLLISCGHLLNAANLVPIYLLLLGKGSWTAPGNLTATPLSGGAIRLIWQDRSQGETAFEIEGKRSGNNDFQLLMSVEGNKLLCNVSALTGYYLAPATEYQFRVRAVDNNRVTDYSNVAIATTAEEPSTAPEAPSHLRANARSSYAIVVSWVDNSDNEYSFLLEQSKGCTGTYTRVTDIVAGSRLYTVTGLSPNQEYCYRLRAENPVGESVWSNEARATTPIDENLPNAPTDLQATSCRGAIGLAQYCFTLTWQDNADNEEQFVLYTMNTLNFPRIWNFSAFLEANTEQFTFCPTSLRPSTTNFRIAAVNSFGQSLFTGKIGSDYVGNCPGPWVPLPPDPPESVTATALSGNTIRLTWADVSNETGYRIHRRLSSNPDFGVITSLGANTTSFEDSGLEPGTLYFYKVEAWNSQGSGTSGVVSATTESNLTVPTGPSDLQVNTVERSSSSLLLSWTDNSDNETNFLIQRSLSFPSGFFEVATVEANTTSYTDSGLVPCTTYYYRVYAMNTQGPSLQYASNPGDTTLPASPENILVSQGSVLHAIYLDWDEESCAAGYNLYEMSDQVNGWQLVNQSGPLTDNMASIYDARDGYVIEPGIALFYRLSSVDSTGHEGDASDYVVGWAGSPIPQKVAASRGLYTDKITLEWKPVQVCPEAQGITPSFLKEYDISWSDTPGGGGNGWIKFKTVPLPGTAYPDGTVSTAQEKVSVDLREATQSFPGVSQGSRYYFVITAAYRDDNNCDHIPDNVSEWESQPSREVVGWAQQQAPSYLPAPAWITASDGTSTTRIDVSWTPVTGAASYRVYRAQSSFGPWSHIRTLAQASFANTTSDNSFNIIAGTGYFYYVIPVDGNGIAGYPSGYDSGFAITNIMDR